VPVPGEPCRLSRTTTKPVLGLQSENLAAIQRVCCRRRGSRRLGRAQNASHWLWSDGGRTVTPAFSCDAGAMRGAGLSPLELPETNVEAVAGLYNPTMPGVLMYEYTPQVTHVVEYGASAYAVFSGRTPPPAEGARFDLYLEGPFKRRS
jgi:hypothetical protein